MALLKRNHSFCGAGILSLLREVGYLRPTLLQQRIIPLILKGRDIAVEAGEGSGKTAAFILPIILILRKGKAGIKAVVLTSSLENSNKISHEFKKFSSRGKEFSIFAFGTLEDFRKEDRVLSKTPDVLIGTPDRIIDHIRRGNLNFSRLQTVVIDEPEDRAKPGFSEDIQFIFSKFPQKKQTILFAPSLDGAVGKLITALKRPVLLSAPAWRQSIPDCEEIFIAMQEEQKLEVLCKLILAEGMESLLILCRNHMDVKRVYKALKEKQINSLYLIENISPLKQKSLLRSFNMGYCSILASTFQAFEIKSLRRLSHIINYDLPTDDQISRSMSFELRKIISLGTDEQYIQLKEMRKVSIKKEGIPSDEQVISGSIKRIVKRIREEEDPVELSRFKKLVRKNVPIFLRSYFTAYLFKLAVQPSLLEGERFTKLFVSVGKNRGLYPRDLTKLFTTKLNLSRTQIGDVKILDNYSFIGIQSAYANTAIAELSGIEFKGRRLTVNFARKKGED